MALPYAQEPDLATGKDDESAVQETSQENATSSASDGFTYVELDAAIIKDAHEYESLLKSLAPKEFDIVESLKEFILESDINDRVYEELDFTVGNDGEFESLLENLAPSDVVNFDDIMQHILNCAIHHKRTQVGISMDLIKMVNIGLSRGDIRKDQLRKTVPGGAERIVELAYLYKIPLRSAQGERLRLQSNTLTFVRAISCFPHMASSLLYDTVGFAKGCPNSSLASEQLPDAMKHSGFCGLIPKCSDPYLMKAYSYAHTAFMVDFGKMINPSDTRSLKEMALTQLDYSKAGVKNLRYSDEFKVGILRSVGLTDPGAFKKLVDVCNNLCKVVGEPELTFATAVKYHIKKNKICFFEDESKDVAAAAQTKNWGDKVKHHDFSASKK
ncbi:hypothetical protein L1987_66735 [Smallanthus sonchifolius]|uniref:Uncharacterized protein n=1 Tax=Smallanthus sonchifolius TaxID=185202 RepID=A0ACB9BY33_9ASTR|nr:hypothetical protein L1987_66735 [Smallanthus sonchifolius]